MSNRDRSRRDPVMPRIIKLEVSEKNMRGRLIAVVVLLAIAFTAIGVAVKDAFTTDPGCVKDIPILETWLDGTRVW